MDMLTLEVMAVQDPCERLSIEGLALDPHHVRTQTMPFIMNTPIHAECARQMLEATSSPSYRRRQLGNLQVVGRREISKPGPACWWCRGWAGW